jgi:hypothetical protein
MQELNGIIKGGNDKLVIRIESCKYYVRDWNGK